MDSRVEWLLDALLNGENIDNFEPRSRLEQYLEAVIEESGADNLDIPRSRLDALLYEMADRAPEAHANAVEEGRTQEWSDFWDVFQHNGEPFNYIYAFFSYWNDQPIIDSNGRTLQPIYNPKYPIKTTYTSAIFHNNANITDTLVDIEFVSPLAYAKTDYLFYNNKKLKTIRKIKIEEGLDVDFSSQYSFYGCSALENLTFEGFIGPSIQLQWSSKLTHDSLMSVINALRDYSEDTSGTAHTLNIGTTNIAKLTADELVIVTQKGWTYK